MPTRDMCESGDPDSPGKCCPACRQPMQLWLTVDPTVGLFVCVPCWIVEPYPATGQPPVVNASEL